MLRELELDAGRPAAQPVEFDMATPLIAGLSVAAAALGGRSMIRAWQVFRTQAAMPRVRRFYPGGFQGEMNRREAALILGVRERATVDKIKEAHKRVMVANHPDAGGSHYVASKINGAKDILMGKGKSRSSIF
ncbi:mitochondrial import inner membrane translocase subunit TIM14-3-like [Miscanthus floridulus]|uniref:mitochondrial import inner membrane translocase subunit TIM14-3-like n=1 Tax=Miscanthus floridulus TaxID=154761 RepID=UPI003457CE77